MTERTAADLVVTIDSEIVGAVDSIRNRFGATGLRQLISLAEAELADTEIALRELSESS
ncbi:MAG TPA: hypothetical protein VMT88_08645 [Actinomycetes bacterium]|nr:hypothetical protein [Actinomycetes bacterium]